MQCSDEARRSLVREHGRNGIDYIEVSDDQRVLSLYLLGRAPEQLAVGNVRIDGGRRVRGLRVVDIDIRCHDEPGRDDCIRVTVDRPGDFSTYRLCLVEQDDRGRPTDTPLEGFDPRYACLDFGFKVGCPSELDCAPAKPGPEAGGVEPAIDYLARDYGTFRRLLLDRLALVMPDWRERHVPDVAMAVVEVMAYIGDQLSYYQDAVATEAYLDTARQRRSVRRHARLVDYRLHEGCNARAFVVVSTDTDIVLPARDVRFTTVPDDDLLDGAVVVSDDDLARLRAGSYVVFESVAAGAIDVVASHSTIRFHTYGNGGCSLPVGSTAATLVDDGLRLAPGDLLLLEEVIGPRTGNPADADPERRHVVRLTSVEPGRDDLLDQAVVEVTWADADALPFTLCISAVVPPECEPVDDISVARGNVVLVDHGRTVADELLPEVPFTWPDARCPTTDCPEEAAPAMGRYQPSLAAMPVTHAVAVRGDEPGRELLRQDPRRAEPQAWLHDGHRWAARFDLLASGPDDRHFVVECDDDGRARLRFGDGRSGPAPSPEAPLRATYRVGNGPVGNVGAGAIRRLAFPQPPDGVTLGVRNPLAASGGRAPEPVAEARLFAPDAFRAELRRAVVPDDYARLAAEGDDRVQQAAATLRWTGSWHEVLVALDPVGAAEAPPVLVDEVAARLERYRRIGHDLAVASAVQVPLDIALLVCVAAEPLRADVRSAVLDALRSLFHPDNQTFGRGVAVSTLVAAAHAVPGVVSATVTRLERLFEGPAGEVESGLLRLGPLEVARCDDDPSFPEWGRLALDLRGGR